MKIAFTLYKYFPYGGLQRDFLRIAQEALVRGHEVHVFVRSWQGDIPEGFNVYTCARKAFTNHGKNRVYYRWLETELKQLQPECTVGFNRMPGLDVYFAADPCLAEKVVGYHPWRLRLPRYKHGLAFESAVFSCDSHATILHLTDQQRSDIMRYYNTEPHRFHRVPPSIDRDRCVRGEKRENLRQQVRRELSVSDDELLLLQVGSGFRVKGVDRSLRAAAALPGHQREKCRLVIVGQDKRGPFESLARRLGILKNVSFLGGRDDIPALLAAADLMLHPAYSESAGMALLEAIVAGLPVLTTDTCGYAFHIDKSDAGKVVASPFDQSVLNRELSTMMEALAGKSFGDVDWQRHALEYAEKEDLYSLAKVSMDKIELAVQNRG